MSDGDELDERYYTCPVRYICSQKRYATRTESHSIVGCVLSFVLWIATNRGRDGQGTGQATCMFRRRCVVVAYFIASQVIENDVL